MAHAQTLRLVGTEPRPLARPSGKDNLFRIERRHGSRESAEGSLTASYRHGDHFGIASFDLVDRSPSGFGVLCDQPIEPGTQITIRSQGIAGVMLSATAVRCVKKGQRWKIGLAMQGPRAA